MRRGPAKAGCRSQGRPYVIRRNGPHFAIGRFVHAGDCLERALGPGFRLAHNDHAPFARIGAGITLRDRGDKLARITEDIEPSRAYAQRIFVSATACAASSCAFARGRVCVGLQQGFGLGGMSFGNHFAKQQFWLAYVPHGSTASVWARADHFRTRSPLLVSIKFVSSPSVVEFTEFRISTRQI